MYINQVKMINAYVPLSKVIQNQGINRPPVALPYMSDRYKAPKVPSGYKAMNFPSLDRPATISQVLRDYSFYDGGYQAHMSWGSPAPGIRDAIVKVANMQAMYAQAGKNGLTPSIYSDVLQEVELFSTQELAGLKGTPDQIVLTVKKLVGKIAANMSLSYEDRIKMTTDLYDRYLLPLMTKMPDLYDPDSGKLITDSSYLFGLLPPLVNPNPIVTTGAPLGDGGSFDPAGGIPAPLAPPNPALRAPAPNTGTAQPPALNFLSELEEKVTKRQLKPVEATPVKRELSFKEKLSGQMGKGTIVFNSEKEKKAYEDNIKWEQEQWEKKKVAKAMEEKSVMKSTPAELMAQLEAVPPKVIQQQFDAAKSHKDRGEEEKIVLSPGELYKREKQQLVKEAVARGMPREKAVKLTNERLKADIAKLKPAKKSK